MGAAGPYVVQFAGLDDSDAPQSKTKYVACGTDSCYFSSTEMFTLKPSSEYTITVYQCKYDTPVVGSTYTWNTLTHGLDDTNEECIRIADNYYAILAKDETTIASTNGKTSITYGYATLESIITEEVTFVDGGLGYVLKRSEDALVFKTSDDDPIFKMKKLAGSDS